MRERYFKIGAIVLTIVLSAVLAITVINEYLHEKRQSDHLRQLQMAARPYEREISDIEEKLSRMEMGINLVERFSQVILCFKVADKEDIDWIEERISTYEYPVTIVSSVMAKDNWDEIIHEISESSIDMDIMFSGITDYEEDKSVLQEMKITAENSGIQVASMWFLNSDEYTNENLDLLSQNGYDGYTQLTDYSVNIVTGTSREGLFYVEHVPIKAGDNKVESSVLLSVEESKPLILFFDVQEIKAAENQTFMEAALDAVQKYENEDMTNVVTVSELLTQQNMQKSDVEERQATYDEYAAQQQIRIDELQEKINEMYSNWKEK